MKNNGCPDEQQVIAAGRAGKVSDSMMQHLKHCAECREIFEITESLNELSHSIPVSALPSVEKLMGLAEYTPESNRRDVVLLPIWVMRLMSGLTFILLGGLGLLTGKSALSELWNELTVWIAGNVPPSVFDRTALTVVAALTVVGLAALAVVVVVSWVSDLWSEIGRERKLDHRQPHHEFF